MPTLGKLYLDNNALTGTVPIELGGLGTLQTYFDLIGLFLFCLFVVAFLFYLLYSRLESSSLFVFFFIPYLVIVFAIAFTDTLYVQNNALTGDWPESFCYDGNAPIDSFGVDCDKVECLCCGDMHCYYSM